MEGEKLPTAQALAAPRPEHPAHDGPGRAIHTEGGLFGGCGRRRPGGGPEHRGQPLNLAGGT